MGLKGPHIMADMCNQRRTSFQQFVVEFDTCLVWELLLLPSNAQTALNFPSLKGARYQH